MEGSEVTHHLFVHILLVCVNCLGVLAKIVEPGEMFSTMTIEWTFARVFSDVPRQMLASAENHSTVTIAPALEGFSRSGTITLVDPSAGDVGKVVDRQRFGLRRHGGGGRGCDD